ncbi:MAG: hypothetical protein RIC55_31865 [Pirellulaceae bacterium]
MSHECLTKEQLTLLLISQDVDQADAEHVGRCPTCRAKLAALREVSDRLSSLHAAVNLRQNESRARLLAELPPRTPAAASPIFRHFTSWLGGLTVSQRIALGGMGMTMVLVLLMLGLTLTSGPASAMERMAQEMQRAKSYKVKLIQEMEFVPKEGEPIKAKIEGVIYWLAPRSYRTELQGNEGRLHTTDVSPAGKPGVSIDHGRKTYERKLVQAGHASPLLTLLDRLGRYSGQADRELGEMLIDGKRATGFVVDAKKIDPDAYSGPVEVWIDAESNLPVRIRLEMNTADGDLVLRWDDFQWNAQLDPKLMDATPPEGYTDATPDPPGLDKLAAGIREALALYAQLSKGHYPRVKIIYGDVTRDKMREMAGLAEMPLAEQFRDKTFRKIQDATYGLAQINAILRENPDAAYHGLEVGPQDKKKVLLRWKLDDGRYHVIYGDLRDETVSAARLRELEG